MNISDMFVPMPKVALNITSKENKNKVRAKAEIKTGLLSLNLFLKNSKERLYKKNEPMTNAKSSADFKIGMLSPKILIINARISMCKGG
jgi:hypothetical protein